MPKKYTIEFVSQYFKKYDCTLLEKTYINNNTKMRYICSCGNESITTFINFKRVSHCRECIIYKSKLSYEFVSTYFKERGCTLLENTYINNYTKMRYICSCGNESSTTFTRFKRLSHCRDCSIKRKISYEFVSKCFKERNCPLLEKTYINDNTKMRYICLCGK